MRLPQTFMPREALKNWREDRRQCARDHDKRSIDYAFASRDISSWSEGRHIYESMRHDVMQFTHVAQMHTFSVTQPIAYVFGVVESCVAAAMGVVVKPAFGFAGGVYGATCGTGVQKQAQAAQTWARFACDLGAMLTIDMAAFVVITAIRLAVFVCAVLLGAASGVVRYGIGAQGYLTALDAHAQQIPKMQASSTWWSRPSHKAPPHKTAKA